MKELKTETEQKNRESRNRKIEENNKEKIINKRYR